MEKLGKFGQQVRRAKQITAVPSDLRSVVMVTASENGITVDDGVGAPEISEDVSVMPVDYSGKRTFRKPSAKGRRGPVVCRSDDGVKGEITLKGVKSPDGVEPTGDCGNCGLAGYPCRLTAYPRGAVTWTDDDGEQHVKAGAVAIEGDVWIGSLEGKVTADLDAGVVRAWHVETDFRAYKDRKGEDAEFHFLTLKAGDEVDSSKSVLVKVKEKWPWTPFGVVVDDAEDTEGEDDLDDVAEDDVDPFDEFIGDDDDDEEDDY